MKKLLIVLIIALFSITGCVTANNSDMVRKNTRITKDDFSGTTWINGPRIGGNIGLFGGYGYLLRHETSTNLFQLYIDVNSQLGWFFFDRAYDADRNKLKFVEIDRSVSGSFIFEYFALTLSKDYLMDHLNRNLKIKIYGKRGAFIIDIPHQYIDGFLKGIK